MFKYSKNWLEKLANEKIDYKDFNKNWLDLQGFEVASETKVNDDVIVELEVKANRPDMLSHLGVLREYYTYKKKGHLPKITSKLSLDGLKDLPIKIEVTTKDVGTLVLLGVSGINNKKQTPKQIKELLEKFGVHSINPLVDISNYIMLELGQPIHIYDLDKVNKKLVFENLLQKEKVVTLSGETVEVPAGSTVIKDASSISCVAGMIGAKAVEVDENTKNIVIEAAHFDPIRLRIASQKMNVNTLASYRFERGVDEGNAKLSALLCAEVITDVCGGVLNSKYVNLKNREPNVKTISVDNVNKILGTTLNAIEIKQLLDSYYYKTKVLDEKQVQVTAPSYRLDIEKEIDVIGDIAQMYGYHNITPSMPNLSVNYEPNHTMLNADNLRTLMLAQGLNECISYSFINEDAYKMLNLTSESKLYSNIPLINPLSNKFSLMRSNMLYSMLNTYVFNLSKNNECEPIFEIGSVFYKDETSDTGYNQRTSLAVLLNGNKFVKGFGLDKSIPYDFYDIKQILEFISSEYSMKLELKPSNETIFEQKRGLDIYFNNKFIGVMGTLNDGYFKNFENGKLIKGEVQYLEIYIDNFKMGTTILEEMSKYPSIVREYNLLVPNGAVYEEYANDIHSAAKEINAISIIDIYKGKGVKEGFTSVLISIEYVSTSKTLTTEEIEVDEQAFLKVLKQKHQIELKL
ncbi:MAG: phenylalanine--tRNA ligase subunit beta [Tenericutes bacterium HGW-Tenericutes-4]|nr:MAG: phenylalanine--tRNA ligase subunit beta [Tenericutes bacterium HGW-Tenericutes-4]